jgi:hypothetical protein
MVQPKYSPEEALQRIKLMMEYDSSKTLDENKKVISEQVSLNTAGSTALGAGLGAAAAAGTTLGASIATGAAFGTAIPIPVVGTALGALVGLGVGMLGTWAFNKDGNAEGFRKLMEVCKAPGASKLVKKMSNGDIRSIAYAIQDSKGTWNDDEDTIAAELGKIQTIADLCAVDKKVPGGLFEFLDNLTDDPDEWKLFTRPIEGMIEDSEVLLTPEEQKKTGSGAGGGTGGRTGGRTGGYKACSGTYEKGCKSDTIAKVQGCLGLVTDGKFGPKTQAALSAKGFTTFKDADVTKICEKTTTVVEPEISGEQQGISGNNTDF